MLLLSSSLKLIAEIALMALIGQWLLGLLAGRQRDNNLVYQLLQVVTRPFVRLTRLIIPRWLSERHLLLATFGLLLSLWLLVTVLKVGLCLQMGMAQCR